MAVVTHVYGETSVSKGTLVFNTEETPIDITFTISNQVETAIDVVSPCLARVYDPVLETNISDVSTARPSNVFTVSALAQTQQHTVAKTSSQQTLTVTAFYYLSVEGTFETSETITIPALVEHTVTYSAGSTPGVTNLPAAQTKIGQVDITLSDQTPLRTGYNFTGWNTAEDGTGMAYAESGTYSTDANVTLYAQWEAITYAVTYLPNGTGVTGMPSAGVKVYGVNYTIPNTIPLRSGYYFLGWHTGNVLLPGQSPAYQPGDTISVDSDLKLNAIWSNEAGYKPKITGSNGTEIPLVVRSDSGGSQDLFGTYALVEFDWQTFASATGAAARLYYKLTSASTWTLAATISPLSGTSGSQSVVIGGGNLDVSKTYNVRIVVEDSTGNTTRFNTTLTMSYMTLDFGGEGKAIGIGTEAPDPTGHANGLMQIAMDTIDANGDPFNGYDRVIGTVTSNGWTCTKWASGKLECEQVGSSSVAFSASGTLYLGTITINLPSIIVSTSSKSIQCESNTYFIYGGGYFTGTTSVTYNVFRAASGTRTLTYIAKVIGTWK